jgi:hypothetical protein
MIAPPWVLLLQTVCHDAAHDDRVSNETFSPQAAAAATAVWENHTAVAGIECDMAFFPEDLTLSRRAFLGAVWRLPRQVLYPCGHENLLFFPPLNATDYHLVLSNCQLEESPYYTKTLSVTVSAHATAQVSWNPTASDESVVAHVRAEMDLSLAVEEFVRQQPKELLSQDLAIESELEVPPEVPLCLDDSPCSSPSSARDPMLLLERLQTQMEKDRQAVDRILTTMGMIAVLLLGFLFKMMWEPHLQRKRPTEVRFSTPASTHFSHRGGATPRPIEHAQHNENDSILHSPSWKTSLIFRTPPPSWKVPATAPASESTITPGGAVPLRSASTGGGDQALAADWRRRQEERRRNRADALNSQQRLVPPTPEDLLSTEETSSEATTAASTVIATQSSLDDDTLTDADRKQMARSLWSFGC